MLRTGLLVVALLVVAASLVGHHVRSHDVVAVEHSQAAAAPHDDGGGHGLLEAVTATCLGLLAGLWVLAAATGPSTVQEERPADRQDLWTRTQRRRRPATPVALGVLLRV